MLVAQVQLWHWGAFALFVLFLLFLDLFVFHREAHPPSRLESVSFTIFWIAMGLAFNAFLWWWQGNHAGMLFLTGFLVEKSLSMDNLFVFAVIFRFFHVPVMYQYRILFWGILGAIGMRLVFILAGISLIEHFKIVLPIFGSFLLYTAYKLARHTGDEVHPEKNLLLRFGRRCLRVCRGDHHQYGQRFFIREAGRWCITPLLLVLLVVESTDLLFAIDSVPAIIGITQDRFIAFSSNVFAILGLRALYFLLAGLMELFCYLHYGLSAVLAFIGLKMIGEYGAKHAGWIPSHGHLISPAVSLGVVATLLGISILASMVATRREKQQMLESWEEPEIPSEKYGWEARTESDNSPNDSPKTSAFQRSLNQ
ncbi:MAG: TerC family protein [Thermoguttaceae bacterium]|nr:TerC family protein [Thermoguttaceae bacterium]MDW8037705.1 TerC family protein [Thermoguttaceae bacterium]